MSTLKWFIIIAMVLLGVNLFQSLVSLDNSLALFLSNETLSETIKPIKDRWALRGQIGDIMSGHFSALAFLAVALSILFQYEANKQMRESVDKQEESIQQTKVSIEQQTEANLEQAKNTLQQAKAIELQAKSIKQQNEALKIQAETLKGQIDELKASREESERQTEEFFIQNMNIKLDRYYKLLEKRVLDFKPEEIKKYTNIKVEKDYNLFKNNTMLFIMAMEARLKTLFDTIELIYNDIEKVKKMHYQKSYEIFYSEFLLWLSGEPMILNLKLIYPRAKEYKVNDIIPSDEFVERFKSSITENIEKVKGDS